MAGVKGRSGGARPGAGRPPKRPAVQPETVEPLEFLERVMRGEIDPTEAQLRAAIAAARVRHGVVGVGGKKAAAAQLAEEVADGRFRQRPAPDVLRRVA